MYSSERQSNATTKKNQDYYLLRDNVEINVSRTHFFFQQNYKLEANPEKSLNKEVKTQRYLLQSARFKNRFLKPEIEMPHS